jgi:carbamoyltransferase
MSGFILGISAFYHNSAASIIADGEILAAVQEERFTRIKNDSSFPINSIKYCLEECNIRISDLDVIIFYDKPLLKFERIIETFFWNAPKGFAQFIRAMPQWLNYKLFLKSRIRRELDAVDSGLNHSYKLLFSNHHLSHAASCFYPSSFTEAAILTVDGVGEWATTTICKGIGNKITLLKEMQFPNSVGLLYSSFTYYLGFKVNSGEYKMMGLAPYGQKGSERVNFFIKCIKEYLVTIHEDGSLSLNQSYFKFTTGLKMVPDKKWEQLFEVSRRLPESQINQVHCDLAMAIQNVTEEIVILMARYAKKITGAQYLCIAGGVGLNCVANGKLEDEGIFDDIYIAPASGDDGGALGAAYAAHFIYNKANRRIIHENDALKGSLLGPPVEEIDIRRVIKKYSVKFEHYNDEGALIKIVADLIEQGNIVGWVQGRMEFGPRALGNRSILADPRRKDMQRKLNLKIKNRESFRPFAPSILADRVEEFFEFQGTSPYMLKTKRVVKEKRVPLPLNYNILEPKEKLRVNRSVIPAVTHIDFSSRIQTVDKDVNPRFHKLITEFEKLTGIPILVNTSFNVRGEPIVCSAEDAYLCFINTDMDFLVINNFILFKG